MFFACVLVTGGKYGIILAVLVIQCLWDTPDSVPLIQTPIPFFPLSLSLLFKEIFKRCQETKKKHKPVAVPIFLIILQKLGRHSASPLLTLSHFSSHKCLTSQLFSEIIFSRVTIKLIRWGRFNREMQILISRHRLKEREVISVLTVEQVCFHLLFLVVICTELIELKVSDGSETDQCAYVYLTVFGLHIQCMNAYEHAAHEVFKSQRVAKKDQIQLEAVVIHVRVWGRERESTSVRMCDHGNICTCVLFVVCTQIC